MGWRGRSPESQRRAKHPGNQMAIFDRGQVDEPRPIRVRIEGPVGHFERQASLARAADRGQGHQTLHRGRCSSASSFSRQTETSSAGGGNCVGYPLDDSTIEPTASLCATQAATASEK